MQDKEFPPQGEVASDEFSELLDALGSETEETIQEALADSEDAMAREIQLARATIEGLRASLAGLEPIGEELAESEQLRLALEAKTHELEVQRRTTLLLLGELGRLLHRLADVDHPLPRRALRRVANSVALSHSEGWTVLADVERRLRSAER